jgi:hypothetical protein
MLFSKNKDKTKRKKKELIRKKGRKEGARRLNGRKKYKKEISLAKICKVTGRSTDGAYELT